MTHDFDARCSVNHNVTKCLRPVSHDGPCVQDPNDWATQPVEASPHYEDTDMATQPVATDEYQPLAWQVVVDGLGYSSVHETDEDGKPGDLVAHTYGDHINLIAAAPRLRSALISLLAHAGTPITHTQIDVFTEARAALAASDFSA